MASTAAVLDILVKAQTNTASAALNRLNTGLRNTTKQGQTATKQTDLLHKSNTRLSSSLKNAAKYALGAGAAYVGLSAARDAVEATTDLAKATLTLKKGFGLTIGTASELGAVLKARGVDTTQLGMAFNTLSRQVEAAKTGSETATKAFTSLGVSQEELKKSSPDQLLFQISDGMQKLGAGTARTAATSALFGRGWKSLGPVLREGSDSLREQLDLANKYGASFGGKSITSIKDLIQTERELKIAQLGLQVQFTEKIAPALIKVGLAFATLIGSIGRVTNAFRNMVSFAQKHAVLFAAALAPMTLGMSLLAVGVFKNWDKIKGAFSSGIQWIKNAWGNITGFLSKPFSAAVGAIRGFINTIIGVINTVLGPVGVHIGEVGKQPAKPVRNLPSKVPPLAGGPPPKPKGTARGGFAGLVPGSGLGDKVMMQALVEPNEGVFIMNKNAMAALQAWNDKVPRFTGGGTLAGGAKSVVGLGAGLLGPGGGTPNVASAIKKLPGTGGLPDWLKPVGDFVLSKVGGFIKDKLTGGADLVGRGMANASNTAKIEAVGRALQGMGFQVSGERVFGGTPTSGHAPGSYHYSNRAIDVNWPNAAKEAAHLIPLYNQLARSNPTELFYQNRGIPGPVPNHFDHLHLAYQRGGSVPRPRHGSHWIRGGSRWSVDEAATLLWQAGLSPAQAGSLARVVPGESGGNPRAHNPSGATGLFQILGQVVGGNLWDPRINALNAVKKFRDAGNSLSPWEAAPSGPAGRILYDLVGGKTTGGKTKVGKKGKGLPKQSMGAFMGMSADDYLAAAQAAIDIENTRRGSLNDLLGGQNLGLLQTFQAGAAQAPLLGLSKPGWPSLSALLPMLSDATAPSGISSGPFLSGSDRGKRLSGRWSSGHDTHVHIHVKDKRLKGMFDVQIERKQRRAARKGNRPMPGARGR